MAYVVRLIALVSFTLGLAASASGETVRLQLGESVTIGSTRVVCGEDNASCGAAQTYTECRLTWSDGSCREYQTTYYARNAGECVEDCRLNWSDGACREENRCRYDASNCCFAKTTCRLTWSDGSCREWAEGRCE